MDNLQVMQNIFLIILLILAKRSIENEQNTTPMDFEDVEPMVLPPNITRSIENEQNTTPMDPEDVEPTVLPPNITNNVSASWERVEKYPKEKFNVMYGTIMDAFSMNDTSKKSILTQNSNDTTHSVGLQQPCLTEVYNTFMTNCYFAYVVGGTRKIKLLFLQACKAEWLNTTTIVETLEGVCKNYKIGFIDHTNPDN